METFFTFMCATLGIMVGLSIPGAVGTVLALLIGGIFSAIKNAKGGSKK